MAGAGLAMGQASEAEGLKGEGAEEMVGKERRVEDLWEKDGGEDGEDQDEEKTRDEAGWPRTAALAAPEWGCSTQPAAICVPFLFVCARCGAYCIS